MVELLRWWLGAAMRAGLFVERLHWRCGCLYTIHSHAADCGAAAGGAAR